MTLTIHDTTMTSDQTDCTPGRHPPGTDGMCPGYLATILDQDTAITAMILADLVGEEDLHQGHRSGRTSRAGRQNSA